MSKNRKTENVVFYVSISYRKILHYFRYNGKNTIYTNIENNGFMKTY